MNLGYTYITCNNENLGTPPRNDEISPKIFVMCYQYNEMAPSVFVKYCVEGETIFYPKVRVFDAPYAAKEVQNSVDT